MTKTIFALVIIAQYLISSPVNANETQMPQGMLGEWSTSESTCQPNPGNDVTVFNITPATIGWYEIACDIRDVHSIRDGVLLHVDCEKGGGIKGSGDIDIRHTASGNLSLYVSPTAFSTELNYNLRRCSGQQMRPPQNVKRRTYWSHNGSIIYLVASGTSREFYYEEPRQGMLEAGARPGALLFQGEAIDGTYNGTAFIFSHHCGAFGYRVSGPILDNYRRVVMRGQAPRVDANCRVFDHFTDILEFQLMDR